MIQVVMSTGNPRVIFGWPWPIPFKTRDPAYGYRYLVGMGMGFVRVGQVQNPWRVVYRGIPYVQYNKTCHRNVMHGRMTWQWLVHGVGDSGWGFVSGNRIWGGCWPFCGPCSLPTSQASLFVIIISAVDSDNDLCHNHQTLWHVWEVPLMCHIVSATWCWGGGCSLGCCGWQCCIMASFLLWLVCRQQLLGGALSVEMRYGGGCDLLVALTTCSLPRHCCSLLLLLLWTPMVACGITALLLSRLVLSVCAVVVVCGWTMVVGGGSQWQQWCFRWWWWEMVVVLV